MLWFITFHCLSYLNYSITFPTPHITFEHDRSHFVQWFLILHPHRTPSINTWSSSLQVFLQNCLPKQSQIHTFNPISISFTFHKHQGSQHYKEPNCICCIVKQGINTELLSLNKRLMCCWACPCRDAARNSDPHPSGAGVLWDTRYRGLRHSGVWLIPWKCNYFQSTEGISSRSSRSYKYDYYGINHCSFLLSSWPKLHFSGIPLTISINFSDLIQKWSNSSSIPINIFFFTDFLIEP